MSEPVRTCVGCGRRSPQRALVRFAAVHGRLEAGRTLPGRGAYTCRTEACFVRARQRRAFARTLRTAVEVPQQLGSRLADSNYTGPLDG